LPWYLVSQEFVFTHSCCSLWRRTINPTKNDSPRFCESLECGSLKLSQNCRTDGNGQEKAGSKLLPWDAFLRLDRRKQLAIRDGWLQALIHENISGKTHVQLARFRLEQTPLFAPDAVAEKFLPR
jgi:hypothetical protein